MVLQKETNGYISVIASACKFVCVFWVLGGVCVYVWICACVFMYILVHVCMGCCFSVFRETADFKQFALPMGSFFTQNDYENNFT